MTEVVDFGGLSIAFDDRLLRPRAWTQAQSRWAAELLLDLPEGDALELCAGAGQIGLLALAQAAQVPARWNRRMVCVDVNPAAAQYLARNAAAAGLADRVEVRTGTILVALIPGERFRLVLADPPWVPSPQTAQFPDDPRLAIDGGADGLRVTRECLHAIERHLAPGGTALLQLAPGEGQADAVARELAGTDLVARERRSFERGVLLRIDRPS